MDTKKKILTVGRELFASYGYEGTTMAMIAGEVGVKKPSLYAHYTSKEQIFKDVLDKEVTDYITFLHESVTADGTSIKQKLYSLLIGHALGNDESSMNFYYRFIKYQPAGLEEYIVGSFAEMESETEKIFETILNLGKKQGEIDRALSNTQIYRTYFLLVDGLSTMPVSYKKEMDEGEYLGIWEVFYRGIEKR